MSPGTLLGILTNIIKMSLKYFHSTWRHADTPIVSSCLFLSKSIRHVMQDKVISNFHHVLKNKYDKQCAKNRSIILILQCFISRIPYLIIMMYDQKNAEVMHNKSHLYFQERKIFEFAHKFRDSPELWRSPHNSHMTLF